MEMNKSNNFGSSTKTEVVDYRESRIDPEPNRVNRSLIKFIASNSILYNDLDLRSSLSDRNLHDLTLRDLFLRKYVLCDPTSNTSLLEKPYLGTSFATDFKGVQRSSKLSIFGDFINYGDNQLVVMMHPQGYTQIADCQGLVGRIINTLLREGATIEELVYTVYKLGTGYSSKQLATKIIDYNDLKSVISSVLSPWKFISRLCDSGFCNYGSPSTFIEPEIVLGIYDFNFTAFNTFGDLISTRVDNFPNGSLSRAKEMYGDIKVKVMQKLLSSSTKFNLSFKDYLAELFNILNNSTLLEVKAKALEISEYDRYELERTKFFKSMGPVRAVSSKKRT